MRYSSLQKTGEVAGQLSRANTIKQAQVNNAHINPCRDLNQGPDSTDHTCDMRNVKAITPQMTWRSSELTT